MLNGKIALITGGSRGIGKEIALKFANNGATVNAGDLVEPDYKHENVKFVKLNVTDRENIKEVASQVKAEYGKLDILVNNAGITRDSLLQRMKEQDWDLVVEINLKGVYNVMQGFVSLLLKSTYGNMSRRSVNNMVIRKIFFFFYYRFIHSLNSQ